MSQTDREVTVRSLDEINRLLAEKEEELARLDARRAALLTQIAGLQQEKAPFLQLQETLLPPARLPSVTNQSSPESKIALFRSLFRGREDVYPRRFESLKTGKHGYAPVPDLYGSPSETRLDFVVTFHGPCALL